MATSDVILSGFEDYTDANGTYVDQEDGTWLLDNAGPPTKDYYIE